MTAFLHICVLICLSSLTVAQPAPPQWPDCYTVTGNLRLPYAELDEPFTAYYEANRNRSRIDYYDIMQTYQIGSRGGADYGSDAKVIPVTTEDYINVKQCFYVNGTATGPVSPQNIFPDITGFKMIGIKNLEGKHCYVWKLTDTIGGKRNEYTLWQDVGSKLAVRYEMMGYDTLLGSHYDKYFVDYHTVVPCKTLPDAVFTTPANLTCTGYPGPGNEGHRVSFNPMREFIHHDDKHVDSMFDNYRKTYNKNYETDREHAQRKTNFRHNLRFINSKNRAAVTYKLAVNQFADLSDDEMRMRRGRLHSTGFNGGMPFNINDYKGMDIPDSFDWRLLGAVTPVKDQAVCGSCWSFGTTGTVEGAYFLKTGQQERFSQQELIDCSWGEGNNGCDGGEDFRSYQWIMKHGLATEDAYGSYMAIDGYCKVKTVDPTAKIVGYVNVTSGSADALKAAIVAHGPVSVGIDASHRTLSFYSHGVYYDKDCGNTPEALDHAVLAVGYGVLNGEPYWLIKNSWSTYWGNDGYVLMSQRDNNCGVTTAATYVLM